MSEEPTSAPITVRADTIGDVPVLRIAGELDMQTTEVVRGELLVRLDVAGGPLVLDLTEVTFLSSSGLALLVEAAQHAERRGTAFVIAAAHRAVLRPIQATNLDEELPVYPRLDHALAALGGPTGARTSSPGD
ncbi:anti-anti-sigma factor [Saccharothrix tamanrassetensis]|uniref:Anti-sigma factor antagonist n=1 Tax=Saccharothrix tamanrassetensis TaxID=1051531 RepID=A0A841CP45_9PSEU|nr:STAS domain-containing protein [Saccharothrix tamanrassetensis]MBB5957286.1 anti-anti-sigma factor [Saccharothrix tamanrassetensis]